MYFNQELICTFPWQEVLKAEKEKKSAVPDKGPMVCNERLENGTPKASPYCKGSEVTLISEVVNGVTTQMTGLSEIQLVAEENKHRSSYYLTRSVDGDMLSEPKFLGFKRSTIEKEMKKYNNCVYSALKDVHRNIFKGTLYTGFYHSVLCKLWENFLESGEEVTVEDYKQEIARLAPKFSSLEFWQDENGKDLVSLLDEAELRAEENKNRSSYCSTWYVGGDLWKGKLRSMEENEVYHRSNFDMPNTKGKSSYGPFEATIDSNGNTVKL